MFNRTRISSVTFHRPFNLPGDDVVYPAGSYDVTIEEEPIHGLSFEAWRRINTWLILQGTGSLKGRTELHPVTTADLARMIDIDSNDPAPVAGGDAAPVPPKETR